MAITEQLSTKKEAVDLRTLYPLPHRIVFRRSWLWIGGYLILLVLVFQRYNPTSNPDIFSTLLGMVSFYCIFLGLFICCAKLLYEEFYRALCWYGIESGSAIVLNGVIVKHRTSLSLSRVSDIYLERNFIDFIFGLYSLNFSTATAASLQHAKIPGLSRNSAVGMQDYLINLIKSMHPETDQAVEETQTVDVPAEEEKLARSDQPSTEALQNSSQPVSNLPELELDPELIQDIEEKFGRHLPNTADHKNTLELTTEK